MAMIIILLPAIYLLFMNIIYLLFYDVVELNILYTYNKYNFGVVMVSLLKVLLLTTKYFLTIFIYDTKNILFKFFLHWKHFNFYILFLLFCNCQLKSKWQQNSHLQLLSNLLKCCSFLSDAKKQALVLSLKTHSFVSDACVYLLSCFLKKLKTHTYTHFLIHIFIIL